VLSSNVPVTDINVLSSINFVKDFFNNHPKYKQIEMTKNNDMIFDNINKYNDEAVNNYNELETSFNLQFNNERIIMKNNMGKSSAEDFNIAVIDDDLRVLEFMEIILSRKNWKVSLYVDAMLFVESLEHTKPDMIFSDIMMQGMTGFELIEYLNIKNSTIPFIIISASYNKEFLLKANNMGVSNFFVKPLKPDIIIKKVEEFFLKKAIKENIIEPNAVKIENGINVS
jgi:PleD family two-component response regulator